MIVQAPTTRSYPLCELTRKRGHNLIPYMGNTQYDASGVCEYCSLTARDYIGGVGPTGDAVRQPCSQLRL